VSRRETSHCVDGVNVHTLRSNADEPSPQLEPLVVGGVGLCRCQVAVGHKPVKHIKLSLPGQREMLRPSVCPAPCVGKPFTLREPIFTSPLVLSD
jgi:hypothetical protein